MIKLTRLNHIPMILNSDLIEHIDAMPDTIVTLTSGQKIVVLETAEDVVEKIVTFRRSLYSPPYINKRPCSNDLAEPDADSEDSTHG